MKENNFLEKLSKFIIAFFGVIGLTIILGIPLFIVSIISIPFFLLFLITRFFSILFQKLSEGSFYIIELLFKIIKTYTKIAVGEKLWEKVEKTQKKKKE